MKNGLQGEVEIAKVEEWKKKYPHGVFSIKKDGKIGYFKNADFAEIDAYYAMSAKSNNISDEWKVLIGLLWIGGCEDLKTNPRYVPDVAKRLQQSINNGESELVNL